jgi:hypothetical protein
MRTLDLKTHMKVEEGLSIWHGEGETREGNGGEDDQST